MTSEQLYLNLLKRCLTRSLFAESFDRIPVNKKTAWRRLRSSGYQTVNRLLARKDMALVHSSRATGETMLSMERMNNIEFCMTDVLRNNIPGDVIETGVWRGGATIFMKAILDVYGSDRTVWVADSFEGLPKPDPKYPADKEDRLWSHSLEVTLEEVKANFARYGLLDDRVRFLKGFFSETMPSAPIDNLAVLRLDGDMYGSTIVVLENLYPKLSPGGYVIIDDYGMFDSCKQATEDYRAKHGLTIPIQWADSSGVYWQKRN